MSTISQEASSTKKAVLYRMVMEKHLCPYGLKTKDFLQRNGFEVEDHWLTNHDQVKDIKEKYNVKTTPQVIIDGERIGGYEDVRQHLGKPVSSPNETSYKPVIALFSITLLMSLSASFAVFDNPLTIKTAEWFIAFSMAVLALLKLQNVETFSTMFLNYDLLAKRWVPYSYIYPFAEGLAGILMIGGLLNWLSIPVALFIGSVGAASVFKAVYIDKRELKCACVGGASNVPLGFISLTENVMMVAMAVWMTLKMF